MTAFGGESILMGRMLDIKGAKVLVVLSHSEDEVIIGWSILQNDDIKKEVIIC